MTITKEQFREMMDKPNFFLVNGNSCTIDGVLYSIECDNENNIVELKEVK